MTIRRRRKLLVAALVVAALFVWDTALGPDSGYWGIPAMRADPPKLPPEARPAGSMRVLFIGNSFTRYWGGQVLIGTKLAMSSPRWQERPPIYEQSTGNGMDLQDHWQHGRAVERIREGNWDYVVLQDFSDGPLNRRGAFFQYGKLLDGEIRKAGAKTVLFMTWSHAEDPKKQARLAEAYNALGHELGAEVVPVGLAFQEALTGRPELKLLEVDGKHPTRAGSYLTACCFYSFFYRRSPVGLSRTIYDRGKEWLVLNEDDALYLQELSFRMISSAPARAGK
jgi:hypothetical protein